MVDDNCEKCKGIGWLRKELGVFDAGFGRLVRCDCNPDLSNEIISKEKELKEPDPEQLDLDW